MSDLTRETLNVLVVLGAVCGLVLFATVMLSLALGLFRITALGRVLVLPFRDADPGRVALTALFIQRLMALEGAWTSGAHEVADLLEKFKNRSQVMAGDAAALRRRPTGDDENTPSPTPLVTGSQLELVGHISTAAGADLGTAPRSIGDEHIVDILLLEDRGSLAGADVGATRLKIAQLKLASASRATTSSRRAGPTPRSAPQTSGSLTNIDRRSPTRTPARSYLPCR